MAAMWRHLMDVRKDFPSADAVEVRSGRIATVFNVGGNNWRLITFIDYPTQIVRIADAMTHAEYDKDAWKRRL
jgi:mRNA interferase HigB